ncbi:MAG: ABC transporter ATP-binding protein [Myxococcota bacterium]|jgi:ABC-2 type transport system ATP-binding protein|nr:ABC transporter ATP-binding protein [Myxococcota bacterium]
MNPKDDVQPSLRLVGICKRFGQLEVLREVSFEIRRGEVFGLLGPNGAGKTTLIRIIVGLLPADKGQVELRGGENGGRSRLIGICPQEVVLWEHLTCLEQLELVATLYGATSSQARQRALALLDGLGLSDKGKVQSRKLSGGMKRRLNLALAVVHEPKVLLLDEPEAGLDPQSRVLVRELIRSLAGRMTVILTSHNMDEVERIADRVGIIDHGRLLVVDTPQALKASVGEGDLLTIELEDGTRDIGQVMEALEALRPGLKVSRDDGALRLQGLHVVEVIADAVGLLRTQDVRMRGLVLRENTLEDVFLALTGRRLA